MKVLGLSASPRVSGNTDTLVKAALEAAREAGADTEFIAVRDLKISPCLGHPDCSDRAQCHHQDDFPKASEAFVTADAVIIGTPVYFWNMTAQMKTFMDRCYFHYRHGRSVAAKATGLIIVAGSSGLEETEQSMRNFLTRGRFYRAAPEALEVLTTNARSPGEVGAQPELLGKARNLGKTLVEKASRS